MDARSFWELRILLFTPPAQFLQPERGSVTSIGRISFPRFLVGRPAKSSHYVRVWLWFPAKDRLWFMLVPFILRLSIRATVLSSIWAMEPSRWGPQRFKRFCPPLQCSGGGLSPCTRFRSPASGRSCHRANCDDPFARQEARGKAPCAAYHSKGPHGAKSFQSPPADESLRSPPFYAGNEDTATDRCAKPSKDKKLLTPNADFVKVL